MDSQDTLINKKNNASTCQNRTPPVTSLSTQHHNWSQRMFNWKAWKSWNPNSKKSPPRHSWSQCAVLLFCSLAFSVGWGGRDGTGSTMADLWLPRNWCLLKAHTSRRKANLWSPLSEYRGNAEARQIRNSSLYLSLCFSLSLYHPHSNLPFFSLCMARLGWGAFLDAVRKKSFMYLHDSFSCCLADCRLPGVQIEMYCKYGAKDKGTAWVHVTDYSSPTYLLSPPPSRFLSLLPSPSLSPSLRAEWQGITEVSN